jgi:hypothetical protein
VVSSACGKSPNACRRWSVFEGMETMTQLEDKAARIIEGIRLPAEIVVC